MRRISLLLLALTVVPTLAVAQPLQLTPEAKVRSEEYLKQMSRLQFTITTLRQTDVAPQSAPKAPSFTVELSTPNEVDFESNPNNDTNVSVYGWITNRTGSPLKLGFVRKQSIPQFWNTSVCFGKNCFASRVDSTVEEAAWEPNEARELVFHMASPPSATDSSVSFVKIFNAADLNDTITVKFIGRAMPWEPVECRVLRFANQTGKETKIRRVYLENNGAFTLSLLNDTVDFPLGDNEPIDVRVCNTLTDGELHYSRIYFETDSGNFQSEFTLRAPSPAGVAPRVAIDAPVRVARLAPNPMTHGALLAIDLESREYAALQLVVCDLGGRELLTHDLTVGEGRSTNRIALPELSSGSYVLLVKKNAEVIDQASFQIVR